MKELRGRFCSTAIGSVPHISPKAIVKKILSEYRDIPFWPQLPRRSFLENMYAQYMEGFPCAVIDEAKKKVWIDTTKDLMGEVEKAYHKIIEEDYGYFTITEKYAAGFYEFLARAKESGLKDALSVKGHVTGPISFGLSVTDQDKQSILYNQELSEALTKILAIKARWQIKKLKEVSENVIIFIDEPYLVSIGSSVVNIKKEDVTARIDEVISAIHSEGALAGIHCCGNTDWSILLGMDLDILNFDAYNFAQSLSLYPEALKGFLERGKSLAWGIVPTSDNKESLNEEALLKTLQKGVGYIEDKGIEKRAILDSMVLTPSCGCGTLDESDADRILSLNAKLPDKLRSFYGK
jgi:hypothetical protein